jgi:hypothetical protein
MPITEKTAQRPAQVLHGRQKLHSGQSTANGAQAKVSTGFPTGQFFHRKKETGSEK